jgi:hypothetical protein
MTASFFVFETALLTFWRIAFPGTLMIICGWLPVIIGRLLKDRDSIVPQGKIEWKTLK